MSDKPARWDELDERDRETLYAARVHPRLDARDVSIALCLPTAGRPDMAQRRAAILATITEYARDYGAPYEVERRVMAEACEDLGRAIQRFVQARWPEMWRVTTHWSDGTFAWVSAVSPSFSSKQEAADWLAGQIATDPRIDGEPYCVRGPEYRPPFKLSGEDIRLAWDGEAAGRIFKL